MAKITLPISIRRELNLKDGDKVAFVEKDGNDILINHMSLKMEKNQNNMRIMIDTNI